MGRLLRRGTTQHTHKARHRRIERRADDCDTDRAQMRQDIKEIKACLLVMGAPLEGDIPPELTCAIVSGSRSQIELEVNGKMVTAGLDPGRPGDVVEIWRAIKNVAKEQAS